MTQQATVNGTDGFPHLPDSGRLWVFGVSRPLSGSEEARLLEEVDAFLEGWKAHGDPLSAAREWRYGRFLLVGVDDRVTPPSGCSIDALVRRLRGLEAEMDVEIVGGAPAWFRDSAAGGDVRRLPRPAFKEKARAGEISGDTVVFDLSVTTIGDLRRGRWELPARESWHGRYLG